MRKIIPLIFSVFSSIALLGQANGGWGNCEFTTVVAMNAFDPSGSNFSCKKVYVQATDEHYSWDGSAWVLQSDDQNAAEVPFTPAGTISATDVQSAIEETEPDIYGSIDVHSDVDITTTPPSSGEILQYNGASFVPLALSATNVSYDNSTSGLTATTTQGAIDEIVAGGTGTDDQALSLSTNTLILEDGGSVDLSPFAQNLYNTSDVLTGNRTASLANFNLQWDLTGTGDFDVLDSGTQAFTIKDNGLVGIGNITPLAPLHIYEATGTSATANNGSIILEHGNSGGASSIYFKSTVNPGNDYAYIEYSEDGSGNGSTTENGLLTIAVENDIEGNAFQDDIAIMPSGNLGVGTTSPAAKLDVEGGTVRFSDYGSGTNTGTLTYYLAVTTNGDVIEANSTVSNNISTISPTTATFNGTAQHDWAPTGLAAAPPYHVYRTDTTADTDLTGISSTGVVDGQKLTILNIGTKKIKLKDQDTNSSAGNRLILPEYKDQEVKKGSSITFIYDTTSSAWRVYSSGN